MTALPADRPEPEDLVVHLARFAAALRERRVRVGLSDEADAISALLLVGLDDREEVRRALRVRKDMVAELGEGDEARKKIAAGLAAFAKTRSDATPVYVSGGRAWRLAADGESLESLATTAADPVSWPIAHDVRPARDALGARGCTECHAGDAPFVHGLLTAHTIVPDTQPPAQTMADAMGLDPVLVQTWETSFRGRDAFKWTSLAALSIAAMVLAVHALALLVAMLRGGRRATTEDGT